jgi:MerR family transcriptional regulator, copper efflux regulator
MSNKEQQLYSIGQAAKNCGVTEKQIRHWEDKGHIPESRRVFCGERSYRQYTEDDFDLISRIKKYLDEGFTLLTAAKKARIEILGKEAA